MKITKSQLREMIVEEIQKLTEESIYRKKIESYSGYDIVDRGNNVIAVAKPGEHWSHDFLITLDDSKSGGPRREIKMSRKQQLKAAHDYIDWVNKTSRKK